MIADPIVRNRGTIGGSFCQADPSEDLSAVGAALKADDGDPGTGGSRTVPVREFHTGPYETVVGPAEILTEMRVPIRPGVGSAYEKVERRAGDWAVAAAGSLRRARRRHRRRRRHRPDRRGRAPLLLARGRGGPAGQARHRGEPGGGGRRPRPSSCNPQADQRGPADYKRHLAGELTLRALRRAVARARGQEA